MSDDAEDPSTQRRSAPLELPAVLRDDETGLPNRMYFEAVSGTVFHIGKRGVPISLALFELPGVGAAGSEALADLGALVTGITRQSDVRARLESDEIVLVLLDCNIYGARVVAERLAEDLTAWCEEGRGLVVHGGVAVATDEMDGPDDLLEEARRALSRAAGDGEVEVA